MIALTSHRWKQLAASPGGDGDLARTLLIEAIDGDESALAELTHQICHQLTVGEVAYAVVPHLVELADAARAVWPLTLVAMVVAARAAAPARAPAIPEDLRADYDSALGRARQLAVAMLGGDALDTADGQALLGTIAALSGHTNLGLHVLLSDGGELACPSCGEAIDFTSDR